MQDNIEGSLGAQLESGDVAWQAVPRASGAHACRSPKNAISRLKCNARGSHFQGECALYHYIPTFQTLRQNSLGHNLSLRQFSWVAGGLAVLRKTKSGAFEIILSWGVRS